MDQGVLSNILQHRKSVIALGGEPSDLLGGNLGRNNSIIFGGGIPTQRKLSSIDHLRNVNIEPPTCSVSFRAHTKAITSIAINETRDIMITGSTDCSIRIWTMCGRYVGTLGQKNGWTLSDRVLDLNKLPQIIPDDVRRVASANTLRTVKGGVHTQWKTVKNALAFLTPIKAKAKGDKEKDEKEKEGKEGKEDKDKQEKEVKLPVLNAKNGLLAKTKNLAAENKKQEATRRPSVTTVWMDDMAMKTIMEFQPVDKVEQTYQKYLENGVTSQILGKTFWNNHKRHRRERAPLSSNYNRDNAPGEGIRPPLAPVPQLTLQDKPSDYFTVSKHNPVRWEAKHAIVYSRLPVASLENTVCPKLGKSIMSELGRTDTIKKWNDGTLQNQIKRNETSNDTHLLGDKPNNFGLIKLASRAKNVQRASNILKNRIKTSNMNLEKLLEQTGKNNKNFGKLAV